ncbi:MAG: YaaA family protein [Firmicutes bacterium]|nr:YaaA family protein [Bacillota bacterium]MCM1402131.1 YaaA family protein [Bacteroides sp.]MCM1477170.1 YaaA family protein [Bacteroides sp.]
MRVLIAESKTMANHELHVAPEDYRRHHPRLDSIATLFMKKWSEWPLGEIASALKVSSSMAAAFKRMAYNFSYKETGRKALDAFTGVVFRAFDYDSLSGDRKRYADSSINIVSSLYGLLKGDDIVKAYRLDFNTPIAPTGETMAKYWKPLITPMLMDCMRASDDNELLDLLPSEGAKCLNWQWIKREMRVIKVDFKSIADGGNLRTPHATLLKKFRGLLLREIVQNKIKSFKELLALESDSMCIDPESDPTSGKITIFV